MEEKNAIVIFRIKEKAWMRAVCGVLMIAILIFTFSITYPGREISFLNINDQPLSAFIAYSLRLFFVIFAFYCFFATLARLREALMMKPILKLCKDRIEFISGFVWKSFPVTEIERIDLLSDEKLMRIKVSKGIFRRHYLQFQDLDFDTKRLKNVMLSYPVQTNFTL